MSGENEWARLAAGDPEALAALRQRIERIGPPKLRHWGVPKGEDRTILDDTLALVWEAARAGEEAPRDWTVWLGFRLRTVVTRHWRMQGPQAEPPDSASGERADAELERSELRRALDDCLAAIPRKNLRRAWELRYGTQPFRPVREVARILGVNESTVMDWSKTARQRIARCLAKKGIWQ